MTKLIEHLLPLINRLISNIIKIATSPVHSLNNTKLKDNLASKYN